MHPQINEIEVTPFRPSRIWRFLKGPIPWSPVCTAARLPGQALAVFLAIHDRTAITGNPTVTLPRKVLGELGVSRDAKARALQALERASLVSVERVTGRTARITLLPAAKHGE